MRSSHSQGRRRSWRLVLFGLFAAVVGADLAYLALIWPDWSVLADGPPPKSAFIRGYEARAEVDRSLPKLAWLPVPDAKLPIWLQHAVVVAEDASFFKHGGVDVEAVSDAVQYNLEHGRLQVGASTISQQTVKNLFLSSERSLGRKWHELILTWRMESNLPKTRILGLYLNVAELGVGIFGAEAAARFYFGNSVGALSFDQCVALAATLPSPIKHNPATRTEFFLKRKQKIYGFLAARGWGPTTGD
ncbi:MAG: transglycosylase domain-containing protein [Deltaproteobacteria bacterium]|nr:transglycosylase domain-containing protein [Deltaproteobacteria bacterium]